MRRRTIPSPDLHTSHLVEHGVTHPAECGNPTRHLFENILAPEILPARSELLCKRREHLPGGPAVAPLPVCPSIVERTELVESRHLQAHDALVLLRHHSRHEVLHE